MGGCLTSSKNKDINVIHPIRITGEEQKDRMSQEESKPTMEGHPTLGICSMEKQNNYVPLKKKKVRETVKSVKHTEKEGVKMINDYAILDYLGQGAFAKVRLAVKRIGEQDKKFALKIFKKSQLKRKRDYIRMNDGQMKIKDALQDVKREIAIMKKLDHPNLVALHEIIENPDKDKIIMVIDYANEGQLIEWDEEEQKFYYVHASPEVPYSEDFLRLLFRDCVKGLQYCKKKYELSIEVHRNQIVHRDLKPQNILMNNGNAMIADFGVSVILGDDELLRTTQGTYQFLSPEACDIKKVKDGIDGFAADIWALGVTFYCFVFMELPFNADTLSNLMDKIAKAELQFPRGHYISTGLESFLKALLTKESQSRPKIDEVTNHYWLNQGSSNLLEEMFYSQLINLIKINWVQHWKTSSHRNFPRKNSHSISGGTSKQYNTQTKIESKHEIIFQQVMEESVK